MSSKGKNIVLAFILVAFLIIFMALMLRGDDPPKDTIEIEQKEYPEYLKKNLAEQNIIMDSLIARKIIRNRRDTIK